MSFRRLLFVLIALCVSGATVLVGRAWMAPPREAVAAAPAPAAQQGARVLVAQGNLAAGQFVRPENLRWQTWPSDDVASAYVVEGKGKVEDLVGSVVRAAIADGEPITDGRIVRPGDRGFLAAVLTPGDRAVTVTVTVSSGLAGFVFPGDRVDLLLTMAMTQENGKMQRHAAETLLTNLRVLAVDQRADDQNKEVVVAKTTTLEVTPKQAETIAVATELGNLSLSLRSLPHGDGNDQPQPFSHTWDSEATHLLGPPEAHDKDQAAVAPTMKVTVVRGADVKQFEFTRSAP
ncbi:MAG TPA: Flp pilus assembly protein CpaB [Stellaceae bacterium]|nr:Flp pilus assembly protein CpaB [Stellaceae bacterium]